MLLGVGSDSSRPQGNNARLPRAPHHQKRPPRKDSEERVVSRKVQSD